MLKCLRRCTWSAWVVYHVWKLQIRKEIKEVKSEKKKSDFSTDQYFRRISVTPQTPKGLKHEKDISKYL